MIKTQPAPKSDRSERTPPVGVKWHSYAELFPWMDDAAFADLKADIAKNGVLEPIVFMGDAILDGRNRYIAARELGIEYPRVEFTGDDPLGFVLAKNLARRHLTDRQRADVAAKIAKLPKGANQHRPIGQSSLAEAAEMMDVSVKAVQRSKDIQEHAGPELKAAYESGEVSQSAAAEVAKLPKDEQAKVVADGAAKEAAKKAREERRAKQAENDRLRDEHRAKLSPDIQRGEAAKARNGSKQAAIVRPEHPDAIRAERDELREAVQSYRQEITDLKAEVKKFAEMKAEYEKGGFEEVIRGKDEVIRAQATRIEAESRDKASWKRSADFWKAEAIKLGYSDREVIELND